jgi:hypothetical protein
MGMKRDYEINENNEKNENIWFFVFFVIFVYFVILFSWWQIPIGSGAIS